MLAIDFNRSLSGSTETVDTEITGMQLALACGLVLAFTFTILLSLQHETGDEGFHTPQIWEFFNGNFVSVQALTVFPLYHSIVAGLLKAFGVFSVELARFLHMLLAALALPAFYGLCRVLQQPQKDLRLLLFLTCPIILPFFSLIYTDIPALLLVLLMVLQTLRKQYWGACIAGLLAVLTRQTNLVWVAFCACLIVVEQWRVSDACSVTELFRRWRAWAPGLLPYMLISILAMWYFMATGHVARGDTHQHEITLNLSNLYYFLLLGFIFFLPYNIANASKIAAILSGYRAWLTVAFAFLLFMYTYDNSHQYNAFGLSFYLRNIILHYTVTIPAFKILMFIAIAWMALSFAVFLQQSKHPDSLILLYFFGCLSFIPLPLIEQRYYIVAYSLFLVFKPRTDPRLDMVALLVYIPINCTLLYLISTHQRFL